MIVGMPETYVRWRWPDGSAGRCYSPSLVVTEYLETGASYPLDDFVARARTALAEGSDRVRALYGFPCGRAAASAEGIEHDARRFAAEPGATVVVDGFDPPR
jgi:uncharacterized repeat protein (TIGR04042 family)